MIPFFCWCCSLMIWLREGNTSRTICVIPYAITIIRSSLSACGTHSSLNIFLIRIILHENFVKKIKFEIDYIIIYMNDYDGPDKHDKSSYQIVPLIHLNISHLWNYSLSLSDCTDFDVEFSELKSLNFKYIISLLSFLILQLASIFIQKINTFLTKKKFSLP